MGRNIYAVAEMAGVSTATVSRALRGDPRIRPATRARVEEAARELHYVPQAAAQRLAGSSVPVLGVVLPHIEGTYYGELLVGFEMQASDLNSSVLLLLANRKPDAREWLRRLVGQVDAIAFMAMSTATDELVRDVAARMPVVTVARAGLPGIAAVWSESEGQADALTGHLIATGRSRFGFVGPVEPGSDIESRYRGFSIALRRHGLDVPPNLEVALDEASGRKLAHQLLAEGLQYDALVCGDDEVAVALVHELQRIGVEVPGRVAVVGWDDMRVARYLQPGLTTVSQPVQTLGAMAAQHLHQRLSGEEVPERTVLPTNIVHRQSCGCTDGQPFITK